MQWLKNDYLDGGIIRMHLPDKMFENVIDVLRNEKPINVYFAAEEDFRALLRSPLMKLNDQIIINRVCRKSATIKGSVPKIRDSRVGKNFIT